MNTIFSRASKNTQRFFFALAAMISIVGGFFAANVAFAAHTATVTVSPTFVKGGSSGTYSFNVANDSGSVNFIDYIKITAPANFSINGNVVCPATWGTVITGIPSSIECMGSGNPTQDKRILPGASKTISFTSISIVADSTNPWTVLTEDNNFDQLTSNPITTVDATAPTISSITTKDTDGDGKVDTATIVFSEPVLDSSFVAGDFSIGGSVGTSISTGTADDNTFDVLVSGGVAGTNAKDVTYTQGNGSDIVGNKLLDVVTGTIVELDGAAPVFMSARTQSPTTIDLTFSEDLDGTTITNADFSVAGFTLTTPDATDTDTPGIVHLTVSSPFGTGETPHVSYTGMVKDNSGLNIAPNRLDVTPSDGIAPVIASTRTLTTTTIEVTFTEAMSAVSKDDFTVAGNTVSNVTFTSGTTATLVLTTPIGTGATPLVSTVATPTGTKDNASVPNTVTGGLTSTPLDGIAPTVVIAAATATSPTKTAPIAMTVTFSETVTGFDATDIVVGNGTVGNFVPVSGTEYTFNITSPGQGTVTADIAGGVAQDANSNVNTVAPQFSIVFDSIAPIAPTVTLLDPINSANKTAATLHIVGEAGTTYSYTIGTVTGSGTLTAGDVTVSGINVSGLTDGTLTASVTLTDEAGNTGVASTDTATKDTVVPNTPVISSIATDEKINNAEVTTIVVTGTAEANSLVNVSLTNGATVSGSQQLTGGATTYSITINGTSLSEETIVPSVTVTDAAGNVSVAATTPTAFKDTITPVISSITSNATGAGWLKVGGTIVFTLTPSTTEVGAHVTGSYNGVALLWATANSGVTYTATYTVAENNTDQTSALQISGVTITDAVGNTSTTGAGTDVVKTIDAHTPVAPVITSIAGSDNKINDSEKGTVHVIGTAEAGSTVNVSLTGGAMVSNSGIATGGNYDIAIDTTTLTDGTVTPSVTVTDVAGNVSSIVVSPTAVKDVVAPTVTLTKNHSDLIVRDADTVVITAAFNEPMTSAPTITIGTLVMNATMTHTTGNNWTYEWNVPSDNNGVVNVTVAGSDIAGNAYAGLTNLTFTIDNVAPVMAITAPTTIATGSTVITFTNDSDATPTVAECSINNSAWVDCTTGVTTLGDVTGFSALSDIPFTLYLRDTDTAGNTGNTQISLEKDTAAPTISSKTPVTNGVGIDPSSNITVVFNEDVVITNVQVTLKKGTNDAVTTAVNFVSGTKTATIDPSESLDNNSTYTVTLTGVTDTVGNTLPTTAWSFTTSASYSINLTTGWNLISLPVVPTNTLASSVLGSTLNDVAKVQSIWKYDPATNDWNVYHPDNSGETSGFTTMTAGEGYWVDYRAETTGTIAGIGNLFQAGGNVPPQKTLAAGWNLIGYYQIENTTNISATKALSTVAGQWTQLRTYGNTDKQFHSVLGTTEMKPGEGYWIFMKSSSYAPYLYGPGDTI